MLTLRSFRAKRLNTKGATSSELVLHFAKNRPARRILVPFDGSPSAVRAVQHVVALVRAGHQSEVLIVNAQAVSSDADWERAERTGRTYSNKPTNC